MVTEGVLVSFAFRNSAFTVFIKYFVIKKDAIIAVLQHSFMSMLFSRITEIQFYVYQPFSLEENQTLKLSIEEMKILFQQHFTSSYYHVDL